MTKAQALADFKEHILPGIKTIEAKNGRVDHCMRAEAWSNYTDSLCTDKIISSKQNYKWTNPF